MSSKHLLMGKWGEILPVEQGKADRLHWLTAVLFLALFAFPLFPLKFTNALFILFSLLTWIGYLSRPKPIRKVLLLNLIFLLPFLPYLAEFVVSGWDPVVRFELEKKLFFLTAPFMIPVFMKVTGFRNYKWALLVFSLSVTAMTLYAFVGLLIDGTPLFPANFENGAFMLRHGFESWSGIHPTYFSAFAITAVCFLTTTDLPRRKAVTTLRYSCIFILVTAVLFLAVRITLIAGAALFILWLILGRRPRAKKFMTAMLVLIFGLVAIFAIPSLNSRVDEVRDWAMGKPGPENTVIQRAAIIRCSRQVFTDHIFWGTGSRNAQPALDECYQKAGWKTDQGLTYNPHNQYLSLGIAYGGFLLLLFLASLSYLFFRTFRIHETKYFGIVIIFFFMSESMLERQMGVYFFGLMGMLFYNFAVVDAGHRHDGRQATG